MRLKAILLLFLIVTLNSRASAILIYGNNADTGVIKELDPATGATGSFTLASSSAIGINGLAVDDADQRLYVSYGSGGATASPTNNLYTYDFSGNLLNSARTPPAGSAGLNFNGLTYANSTLYGVRQNGTNGIAGIYALNPSTGTTTLAGALSQSGTVFYNFQDIDYDAADHVFIGDNATVNGPGGTSSGIYSIALPASPSSLCTVTYLTALPSDAPAGDSTPDGLAYDGSTGIVYMTYNQSTTIDRLQVNIPNSTFTYLADATGPAQTSGAAGDAAFSNALTISAAPEPSSLLLLIPSFTALLGLRRQSHRDLKTETNRQKRNFHPQEGIVHAP